jgi:hypothetical protein
MIGKLHIYNSKKIFACCDKELINTTINYNDVDITFNSSFYGDQVISEDLFLEHIDNCNQANIFGKKACDILLVNNKIRKDQIIYINKIPHVQIYKI